MTFTRLLFAACLVLPLAGALPGIVPVLAESQGVVAVVNDKPITEYDISQRIALMKTLGDIPAEGLTRKRALKSLIDEQIKLVEAAKYKMLPSEKEVREQIARMAKGMDSTPENLSTLLRKQGIGDSTFKRYVTALIGFNRLISGKYRNDLAVSPQDVDAKYAEIKSENNAQVSKVMNDPRMKAVTVYSLMEISLPVEGNDTMLLQARAIEAQQFAKRFKGCGNARAAAEGIFNVKVGKKFDADATKLPKQMRAALDKMGTGRALGPMRGKEGIQLIAFCGSRKLTPPKPDFKLPTREQVERLLINEKYDGFEEEHLKSVRSSVYIEYRNSASAQQ